MQVAAGDQDQDPQEPLHLPPHVHPHHLPLPVRRDPPHLVPPNFWPPSSLLQGLVGWFFSLQGDPLGSFLQLIFSSSVVWSISFTVCSNMSQFVYLVCSFRFHLLFFLWIPPGMVVCIHLLYSICIPFLHTIPKINRNSEMDRGMQLGQGLKGLSHEILGGSFQGLLHVLIKLFTFYGRDSFQVTKNHAIQH